MTDTNERRDDRNDGVDDNDALTRAARKLGQDREYTGTGTPDMAVNSVPGNDDLPEDRVAGAPLGDRDGELGTSEQRDALAGVRN